MQLISRRDTGALARWWFSVDWTVLGAVFLMMALGVIFSLAASPPVAERIGLDSFHFFRRHIMFLLPAMAMLIGFSFLSGRQARRVALAVFLGGLALMVAALVIGPQVKGAKRWISLGFFSLQPSEFVKPALIVLGAWLLSLSRAREDARLAFVAWGMYGLFVVLLLLQPDMGQTLLISAVWGILLYLHGLRWRFILGLGAAGVAGLGFAFVFFSHVRARIMRFIDPPRLADGARDQVDFALDAFRNGGLFGAGPGGGRANRYLPDAHTDFLFAAVGEEFGLVANLLILALIGFVVLRVLSRAARITDPFRRLAVSGLASLFGLQAFINMGVNVHLLPAKGMTLPFISYGGSSLWAMALTMGLALALMRPAAEDEVAHYTPMANTARAQGA